jgi:uncharacterized membrane protein YfcA
MFTMNDPLALVALVAGALAASTLAAVTGFGGAAVLTPILVGVFGVRDAIPILTVAQLVGNASRVWFNRRELNLAVVGWFALGSVPAAVLGGILFARLSAPLLLRLLGVFLLASVAYRHWRNEPARQMPLRAFAPLGAASGFLSALLGSVGPLMAPFFLSYGLARGAYIGTEALATVVMHITKLATYGSLDVLTPAALRAGLLLGPIMVLGSFLGKRIVDRVSERVFVILIEAVLIVAGLMFLLRPV